MNCIDIYLASIEKKLPELASDKDLVAACPEIFKNASALSRLRMTSNCPSYLFLSPQNIRYLRADVLSWLRSKYKEASSLQGEQLC